MISKPVCLALLVLSSYTLASPLPQAEGEEEGIINNVPRKLDNTIFFVQAELLTKRPSRLLLGSSMILHIPFFPLIVDLVCNILLNSFSRSHYMERISKKLTFFRKLFG